MPTRVNTPLIFARLFLSETECILSVPLDYPMDREFFRAGKNRVEEWLRSINLSGHVKIVMERSRVQENGDEKTVTGADALTFTFNAIALQDFRMIQCYEMIAVFYKESEEQAILINIAGISL